MYAEEYVDEKTTQNQQICLNEVRTECNYWDSLLTLNMYCLKKMVTFGNERIWGEKKYVNILGRTLPINSGGPNMYAEQYIEDRNIQNKKYAYTNS